MKTLYRNGVNSLKSSVNWSALEAEKTRYNQVCAEQRAIVRAMIDKGIDSNKIYQDACRARHDGESEAEKAFRVVSLGVLRAGPKAYFKRYAV